MFLLYSILANYQWEKVLQFALPQQHNKVKSIKSRCVSHQSSLSKYNLCVF